MSASSIVCMTYYDVLLLHFTGPPAPITARTHSTPQIIMYMTGMLSAPLPLLNAGRPCLRPPPALREWGPGPPPTGTCAAPHPPHLQGEINT
eukprot:1175927-Prorocentrum_minimum.AAC.3